MLAIYRASAGSGKTFTLAREYIKYLLGEYDTDTGEWRLSKRSNHKAILGVTFTNKATDEMKRRIIHELALLASKERGWEAIKSDYLARLTADLHCTETQLSAAADKALKALLNDFSHFHISTIDSFFQGVLRAFAREADLASNYEVSLDREAHISSAVDHMLSSLRHDDAKNKERNRQLSDWLIRLMFDRLSEGKTYNLFNRSAAMFKDVVDFINKITNETYLEHKDTIKDYINSETDRLNGFLDELEKARKNLIDEISSTLDQLVYEIGLVGLNQNEFLLRHVVDLITDWSGDMPALKKLKGNVPKTPENIAGDPSTGTLKKFDISRFPDLANALRSFGAVIVKNTPAIFTIRKLKERSYTLGLLSRAYEELDRMLNDSNTMLLSDTNTILSDLIGDDPTGAPYIYERMGTELRHFLIDEFQDTSKLQWKNIHPLLVNGLSEENESLIIGDEKQCIYRFRNSDPELLGSEVTKELGGFLPPPGTIDLLDTNHRSRRVIVEFNNKVFDHVAGKLGFSGVYANVSQKFKEDNGGYVRLMHIDSSTDPASVCLTTSEDDPSLAVRGKVFSDGDGALWVMMENMVRQLNSGYKPGEIAVLVRSTIEGRNVIDFIRRAPQLNPNWPELRIVSDDSMSIGVSPAVRLVVSAMRSIAFVSRNATSDENNGAAGEENPESKRPTFKEKMQARARFEHTFETELNSGLSRSDALKAAIDAQLSAVDAAEDHSQEDSGNRFSVTDLLRSVDLYSLVETIIDKVKRPEMTEKENIFLSAFQDLVIDFSRLNNADLRDFLRWWDAVGSSTKVALPPDDEAIRVMTIHKSKGLEFPCVHIPYGSFVMVKFKDPVWMDISSLPNFMGISAETAPKVFPLVPGDWMLNTPLKSEYEARWNESMLDSLNVAYVAFTRAESELIISLEKIIKTKDSKNDYFGFYIWPLTENGSEKPLWESGSFTRPIIGSAKPKKTMEADMTEALPPYSPIVREDLLSKSRLEVDNS